MTNNNPNAELIARAKALKAINARNKRKVQEHRRQIAIAKANREGIAHPGRFMTKYKYG